MAGPTALFVTSLQQSLGETYTLARFACELRSEGWHTPFLASSFALAFLRDQGVPVRPLVEDRRANRRTLEVAMERSRPDLLVSADPYLSWATDSRKWWSTDWLLEGGVPVVTFDHLKFHPEPCDIRLAFLDRFLHDPSLAAGLEGVPEGARPHPVVHVPALPEGFTTLVRPCPSHHPDPGPDPRIHTYDTTRGEVEAAVNRGAVRRRLGLPTGDKVIVLPAGSWAMELSKVLRLPYPHLLADLLLRYLSGAPEPVHLVFVGSELERATEVRGRSTLHMLDGLPFRDMRDLLVTADLVLCDNASSATAGRAVMSGVVAGALLGSVSVRRHGGRLELEAPFELTPFVADTLLALERERPGAVFPFSVYPLGWREEMKPLFADNLYTEALDWMELYDEPATTRRLQALLFDRGLRRSLRENQAEYRRRVRSLPGAVELVEAALAPPPVMAAGSAG